MGWVFAIPVVCRLHLILARIEFTVTFGCLVSLLLFVTGGYFVKCVPSITVLVHLLC
jgi:hypothetical protein